MIGLFEGPLDGTRVGEEVGFSVGQQDGLCKSKLEGLTVAINVGTIDKELVDGLQVGFDVGVRDEVV